MKKLIVFALALLVTANVFAQITEEMKASEARFAKMEKLVTVPKTSGLATIDGLAANCGEIAINAVGITPLLQNMYYRSVGQSNDGIIDVTVKKPTLVEAVELSSRITAQALLIKDASDKVQGAANEIKAIRNPLQLKSPTSCLNYSKDVLATAGEESVFQLKAIGEIIKTLSDGNNL